MKSDINLPAGSSRIQVFILRAITFHAFSSHGSYDLENGEENRLPLSISDLRSAGMLKVSFAKFFCEII